MLVAYAGKETEPTPDPRWARAYDKFKRGADTVQIAEFYHVYERTVLKWINIERSSRRGLPSPYEDRPQHSRRIMVVNGVPGRQS